MCGIVGRWLHGQPPAPIEQALDRLAHRGPDDAGVWADPRSGLELGHRRLAIIDPSPAGHQPMLTSDGRYVLVFNGELYNYRELRAELAALGHVFRGGSDTEVLLAMFVEYGEHMLRRLNGMFALALFDTARSELWLARDAFGIKPLYFSDQAAGFSFASELKALLALAPVASELDVPALYRYLSFLWCPGSGTPLRSVSKLPPGELLLVRGGRLVERRRWAAPAFAAGGDRERAGPSEVARALRNAVERQLVSDVPLGAFLSGGLDSSAVVAFARQRHPNLDCFTIVPSGGPDAGDSSDPPFARQVARHLGVRLHEVPISSARMAADVEQMVYWLDEPLADPASLNVLYISLAARQQGIKVLLSGVGGDDLFAGYRRHRALAAEPLWSWLPARLRRGLRLGSGALQRLAGANLAWPGARSAGALSRRAARALAYADGAPDARLLGYFAWADSGLLRGLFAEQHRPSLTLAALNEPLVELLETLPADLSPLERLLALEQRFFLGDHNLPYADKMSMAAGVEVRVPFLDPELVALANGLPAGFKQRGQHGKWILKRALEPYLPRDVIYRPKAGFGAPLRRWLRGELGDLLRDVLSPRRLAERGLFDPARVSALVEADRRGEVDAAYPIFALCCVELWCRHFSSGQRLGGQPIARVASNGEVRRP
jgi:asparagine synthase (glutamine-hydrolysing)